MGIRDFIDSHFLHFNAGTMADAARSLDLFCKSGGRIMISLAGAMSTAQIGRSLVPAIKSGFINAICCTGANLEEDLFFLVAASNYERIPKWRELSIEDEIELHNKGLNRVTDTCIPEEEAIRKIEVELLKVWKKSDENGEKKLPHEFLYEILRNEQLIEHYESNTNHSWLLAAAEVNLPLFVPGWEDSTLGNIFAARCLDGSISNPEIVHSGIFYMYELTKWYQQQQPNSVGLLQIGGGIAGDFAISVVPMLRQDLKVEIPLWSWFCQISDSTTSYGSYSGAIPSEKITWGKLSRDTPNFVIESDATIVLPLILAYLLDW